MVSLSHNMICPKCQTICDLSLMPDHFEECQPGQNVLIAFIYYCLLSPFHIL